jgi:hypothetical protein
MDLHSIQLPFFERMINQSPARIRNDAPPLEFRGKPVTDFNFAVHPIDLVSSDGSRIFITAPDAGGEALVIRKLL